MSVVYKKLEEVCEILDSQRVPITAKDRKSGVYPYYGANGLQDHVSDYIFDDELVLLAEDGGNFGSKDRPIAYRVSGKCWVNNHAHVLKAKSDIHIDYLCYALMFYNTDGLVNGATRQKLTQAAMRQMVIPYRCMKEQEQIVDEISRVFHLIAVRNEELDLLEQLVKSRFIELFGDAPDEEKVTMAAICKIITDGTHQPPKFVSEGIPFLFVSNIVTNEISYDAQKFISEETYAELIKRTPIAIGDILLSTVGSYGHPAVVKTEKPFCFQRHIAYLKPNADIVDSEYLRGAILSADVQRQIDEGVKGIAQKTLNLSEIRKIKLPLPPIEQQKQFAAFVEQTDKSKFFACQTLSFSLKLANNLQSWREKQYDY